MRIALLGYGKMGKIIESIALKRNHTIDLKIDIDNYKSFCANDLKDIDVAIEFSIPDAAYNNIKICLEAGIPVVSGTTGWLEKFEEVKSFCEKQKTGFFYASNYSLGVNLFFETNRKLAELMNKYNEYNVDLTEIHHTQKLDAPSGTAITLAEGIIGKIDRKTNWELDGSKEDPVISIKAIREKDVPGTHTVTYDSEVDTIEITHTAKSRQGFALGAVCAAEYIIGKEGIYGMKEMLGI